MNQLEKEVFHLFHLTLDDKSKEKIDNYEIGGDAYQQQGVMTGAYANAVQNAASNSNGAANGFMGIGMMNMASGNAFGGVANGNGAAPMTPQQDAATKAQTPVKPEVPVEAPATPEVAEEKPQNNSWKCSKCGTENTGKFCTQCGEKKAEAKFCTNCGNKLEADAKFCPECGTKA